MNDTHAFETNGRGSSVIAPQAPAERPTEQPLILEPETQAPANDVPEVATTQPHRSMKRILAAALGMGAIVAGTVGYRWWQYASTHEATDNAAIAGHVYQVSSRISGNVIRVPVKITFDADSIHGYESQLSPGMSAEIAVAVGQ